MGEQYVWQPWEGELTATRPRVGNAKRGPREGALPTKGSWEVIKDHGEGHLIRILGRGKVTF